MVSNYILYCIRDFLKYIGFDEYKHFSPGRCAMKTEFYRWLQQIHSSLSLTCVCLLPPAFFHLKVICRNEQYSWGIYQMLSSEILCAVHLIG